MGTSKIIMLSGLFLVIGIYSVSYGVADESNFELSSATANSIQAEQIARSGISLAMTNMGADSLMHTFSDVSTDAMCGSIVFSGSQVGLPSSQSQITSTGNFNGKIVVVNALFSFERNRWRLVRIYTPPTT